MTVLWIAGPRAAGKSTVGWSLFSRLTARAKAGYVDLAQVTFATPPLDAAGRARRLDAVRRVHRQAGARHLVVTGDHADLVPGAKLAWLHASRDQLVARLLLRGAGQGPPIPGDDLRGLAEEELRRLAVPTPAPAAADLVVDTDGRTATAIADELLDRFFSG
ncbi:AAA family ATPase [Saccharothrix sp. S26]|uniref:AAA family ATPase n=1 Tax=Saccharothrix sp. S26 TaxID=2907215 RepID=UPI001F457460|nr:AAA family ATPase [Saccharothrix sp. S26]MCE6998831.1 AAA family ATPase [Saccharothrix sp. S26]